MIYFRNALLSFAASNQGYILALTACDKRPSTPFVFGHHRSTTANNPPNCCSVDVNIGFKVGCRR